VPVADQKTIGVALATRNGARYIARQLDSILHQDRPPDEIVICDDDSTDGTPELVSEIVNPSGISCRIERNASRLGPIGNFSRAISLTSSSIIALADQDDVWERNKLTVLGAAFNADRSLTALFSNASLIDADDRPIRGSLWQRSGLSRAARSRIDEDALGQLCRWNVVAGATLAFRSCLVRTLLPPPEATMHDYWIALMAAATGTVAAVPACLVRYRLHRTNTVGIPRNILALGVARTRDRDARLQELVLFEMALERARVHGASPESLRSLAEKVEFLRDRSELSQASTRRMKPVARHLVSGRYHRLGHGLRSALHDLVIGS
jgi:Glycosyl transferase family 2